MASNAANLQVVDSTKTSSNPENKFTSTFGFEGTTTAEDLSLSTAFAPFVDEPGVWMGRNSTTILNQNEVVSFKCKDVAKIPNNLKLPENTTILRNGVQYAIKVEEDLRTFSSIDPSFQEDDPICMWLVVQHPNSEFINNHVVEGVLERLNLALKKSDGTYRFDDLMRNAVKPN